MNPKPALEIECRHCGQRFVEMVDLLFHRCAAQTGARKARTPRTRHQPLLSRRTRVDAVSGTERRALDTKGAPDTEGAPERTPGARRRQTSAGPRWRRRPEVARAQ